MVHWDGKVTARHIIPTEVGGFVPLAKAESPHWQMAGPEGVVITEVANTHRRWR
ncbi:hypothetical protein [Persicobacter diffluens]|uniref:Uncharacterized protein n=1 Tax=Persicobacter diffluens TaxID=981 RepID=A0AAN4W3L3_9BACT|nr:hypothetical protein PEDI_39020 [Persicobacter diffluens]